MDTGVTKKERWISNIKFLLVAGGGLFGDGYLNVTIGLVVPMIGYIYFQDNKGSVPAIQGDEIKGSFSIGMICGQLLFGTLGDALGRHRVYGKECIFTMVGTLLVILLPWKGLDHNGVVAWLSVFRCITGMGTGGDYPMTSTLSAEHTIMGTRARLIMLVFTGIALGSLAAGIVFVVLLAAFKSGIESDILRLEWVWRLLLGLGIIPVAFTLYARLKMKETKPYEKYVAKETSLVDKTKRGYLDQMRDFREYFGQWRHAKVLFATAFCWFLYDIAFYGVSLNQSIILNLIGFGTGKTKYETLWNTAVGNIIVLFAGNIPGFYIGVFLPDLVGRVRLQFWTSIGACVIYAIWAGVSEIASSGGLITLFTLSQLILCCGPNMTTFLMPVELFPTRVRGTGHGISAAAGKAGAVLTAFSFGNLVQSFGLRGAIGFFSGVMALVALFTLWIPETKGKTIEEIEAGVMYGDDVVERERSGSSSAPSVLAGDVENKAADIGVKAKSVPSVE